MDKTKRRFIIFMVCFVVFTVVLGLIFWPFIKNLQNVEYREKFTSWVASLGIYGVLILFAVQVLQIVVAVIPGGPIELIAGAAYGSWGGLCILEAGVLAASMLIFFMVRKFGSPFIVRFFGANVFDTWGFLSNRKKTALVTFILFLIPGIPKDTLTYLAPLTKLSLLQFTAISVVARFPALFSTTVMGNAAVRGNWLVVILVFGITAVLG
ncbi:MAG: VTT domain-containing protein, partial [Treponema sp.]|nr:VTT domain-containing protein [Treponema sp.]